MGGWPGPAAVTRRPGSAGGCAGGGRGWGPAEPGSALGLGGEGSGVGRRGRRAVLGRQVSAEPRRCARRP